MKNICIIISTIWIGLITNSAFSQISPPGLGEANTASWTAVGIRQELDTVVGKGWQSMSYVGLGRKSNPTNFNPLYKPVLFVLNQEFYHQFHQNLQYSFAVSYRNQKVYDELSPFEQKNPSVEQEFRIYGRFSYLLKTSRFKFVPTFRQEFRKFFTSEFKSTPTDFQFRTRLRLQLTFNLDLKKTHRLIASSEQLFSISKENNPSAWTDFNYKESRFSLYYSYSPPKVPLIFNVGYMHNLVGFRNNFDVHYIAFDIIIENPFKLMKRNKEKIIENLE